MHADVIDRPYASLHLGPRRTLEVSRNEGEINMHTDTLQLIDNSARGVGKGGTRMSPNLSVTEVARLARTMTGSGRRLTCSTAARRPESSVTPTRRTRKRSCGRSRERSPTRCRQSTSSGSTWA